MRESARIAMCLPGAATPEGFAFRTLRCACVLALLVTFAACAGEHPTEVASEFPVRFVVTNHLFAPVMISVDGAPYLGLKSGASAGITVPSSAQWLTWESAKPMDADGVPIPDDIGAVKIAVGGINRSMDITNVIADQAYITARIFNLTSAAVSIGVWDGTSASCAAALPAASTTAAGYTQIGYYRLLSATEVRAYSDPEQCTGRWVAWTASQLGAYSLKSGLLTLVLDVTP